MTAASITTNSNNNNCSCFIKCGATCIVSQCPQNALLLLLLTIALNEVMCCWCMVGVLGYGMVFECVLVVGVFFVLWTVSLHDSALYTVNRSEAAGGIVSESFRVGLVFENLFDRPVLDYWNIHLWEWGVFENSTKLLGLNSHTHVRHYEYKMRMEGCCWPTGSFNIDAAGLAQ